MNSYRVECGNGASYVVGAPTPKEAVKLVKRMYRVRSVRGVCLASDTRSQLKDQPNLLKSGT